MKRENELNTNIMFKEGNKELTNKRQCAAIEQSSRINLIDNLKLFFACNNRQEDTGNSMLPLDVMGEIVKFTYPFEDIPKFLKLVVEGEQDQAEAMLKENPALALCPGDITDLSGRAFKNITGFQYAVWALDSHMWEMMLRPYLPEDAAREQMKGLDTGSWVAEHSKSASWQNLINALDEFIKLCNQTKWNEATTQWNGAVGNAQQQLPVHVVNQYCHPTRSFHPCPNFATEATLPRSRTLNYGNWFTGSYNGVTIGKNCFAVVRGAWATESGVGKPLASHGCLVLLFASVDFAALVEYLKNQTQLREQLFSDLTNGVDYSSAKLAIT